MTDTRNGRAPFNWPAVFMFIVSTVPVVTVFPWYAWKFGFDAWEWTWFFVLCFATGLSITGGYHRFWAHRSYQASKPLQIFYMLFGAMSLQNSILVWASMHRVHHRHVDDVDKDPYSIKRGLWFAHMGWMLRNYPSGELDLSNARDLEANPIVRFQHKYYLWIAVGMNFGLAFLLGWANGDIWGCLLLPGFMRLVVSHHVTFFINSLAHYWGRQPYTSQNTARDNDVLAFFTYGEGYHNFHHIFASDYRNGLQWWQWDPTKWLIAGLSYVGLTSNLRRMPDVMIQQARLDMQFQKLEQKLANQKHRRHLHNPIDMEKLRAQLAHEAEALKATLAEWAKIRDEWYAEARERLMQRWEKAKFRAHAREVLYRMRMQHRRLQLLNAQFA